MWQFHVFTSKLCVTPVVLDLSLASKQWDVIWDKITVVMFSFIASCIVNYSYPWICLKLKKLGQSSWSI